MSGGKLELALKALHHLMRWRADIFYNTYSGSACRKVPDIVVPIGRLSILEHFDWIIEICFPK